MRDMRAPKGWTFVGTNAIEFGNMETKRERIQRERKFDNVIRNTKTLSLEELDKQSKALADARAAEKASLMQAFANGKLKSKRLIKIAKGYSKTAKA